MDQKGKTSTVSGKKEKENPHYMQAFSLDTQGKTHRVSMDVWGIDIRTLENNHCGL